MSEFKKNHPKLSEAFAVASGIGIGVGGGIVVPGMMMGNTIPSLIPCIGVALMGIGAGTLGIEAYKALKPK